MTSLSSKTHQRKRHQIKNSDAMANTTLYELLINTKHKIPHIDNIRGQCQLFRF